MDPNGRRQALRALRTAANAVVAEAERARDVGQILSDVSVLEGAFLQAVAAGIAPRVALEQAFGGECADAVMATARAAITELHAGDMDASGGHARERPVILPERFPSTEEIEEAIALPERFTDPNQAQLVADPVAYDARAVDEAAETLGAMLDDRQRRVAARMLVRVRGSAEFARVRAALRRRRTVAGGLRRSRAARSPRRTRRATVSPSRAGPTPSEPPPAEPGPHRAERPRVGDAVVLGVRALDADELLSPPALPEYLSEDLLWRAGRPAIVVGPRACGKTLAVQSAALSFASGARAIWDHFPVGRRARVLHIEHGHGTRAARRYQRLVLGMGLSAESLRDHLRLVPGPRIGLTDARGRDAYRRAVEGWDICILDRLDSFIPGLADNDSRVGDYLDEILTPLSEDTGCAFVVLHDSRSVHECACHPLLRFEHISREALGASEPSAHQLRRVTRESTALVPGGTSRASFFLEFADVPGQDSAPPQGGVRVVHRVHEDVKAEARAENLTASVLRYLRERTLAGQAVCGIEALATAMHVHRRAAGDAVRRLEAAKLVVNEPERVGRGAAKPRFYACSCADFARPHPVDPFGVSR